MKDGLTYNAYYPFDKANFESADSKETISVSYIGQEQTGTDCCVGPFDYTYAERINRKNGPYDDDGTVLEEVIHLLKQDNDTRKAVLPIFLGSDTANYDGSCRIPCSMYYDFLIRDTGNGKQLNITYHQRSADFVGHFGDDVYLAWCLMEYVAERVGVKPGYLFHTIDSLHAYKRDWHFLKTSIDEI